ncbi:sensor histidine kinase [Pedobacter jamesrossensis]|uniref:Sensor histidine kinase n=1 Tax=Pedobacter jamesrossensis TaxID=1908238 RepID=A0ABV8NLN1_9SPHI
MNKSISAWFKRRWLHILVWALFIAYEILVIWGMQGTFSTPLNYAVHYFLLIGWFYLAAEYVYPWSLKYLLSAFWRVPLALVALFMLFLLANFAVDYLLIHYGFLEGRAEPKLNGIYTSRILYRWVYVFGISVAYYFMMNFIKQKNISTALEERRLHLIIEDERTKRALSKAHNDFLKVQINPHFLFNTLDFVYHNVNVHSPEAGDAIIKLSEMMRYAVDSSEQDDFILLSDEIEQVEKLVYLYQLRKNMELNIVLDFAEEARALRFIPLVLMTLVENIFKHGNVADEQVGVQVYVAVEHDHLVIETFNALNIGFKSNSNHSGLRNINERLRFAYGQQVKTSFGIEGNIFNAKIMVPVQSINYQLVRKGLLTPELN